MKPLDQVEVRVAFCFPDTYELGMSNLGMRILYGIMNEMDGVWCERVFAPWGDMEEAMKAHDLPLWALESQDPVKDFDMIAFTIGYEMSYSNVVNMLRLSQVPIYSRDRKELKNLVFAGGVCAYNPEPLADFVDFFPWERGGDHSRDCFVVPESQEGRLDQAAFFGSGFPYFRGLCPWLLYPYLPPRWDSSGGYA